uniref:probable G-protein coupled receptor 139 n=1 Tax=Pristiophorus japonicus TaxID=55135 RepID=UPI00398ED380
MHEPISGQVYATFYLILGAVGVPANVLAIVILTRGKCGLSKCITYYLVAMAVSDLMVIVTSVILNRIFSVYFPASFLSITPVCCLKTVLLYAAKDSSVWLTVAFTFDRCVAICCQKLKTKYCTERTAAVVIGVVCTLSCLRSIPWYFAFTPLYVFNNVPCYCNFKSDFYTSPPWIAFAMVNLVGTPFLPIFLILLFNAWTVRHILVSSRIRRALLGKKIAECGNDSEMENRRQSIILLLAISANFILLWLTFVAHFIFARINASYIYSTSNPMFVFAEAGYMLLLLSCSTNTCIYAVIQVKFREEMKYIIIYPLRQIVKLFKP